MSLRLLFVAGALMLAAAAAAAPAGVVIDRKVFVPDARVNAELRRITASRQFDEAAARELVQIMTPDGLTPNEVDLIYELVAARTPVTVQLTAKDYFEMPPPNPAARDYLGLLKMVLETPELNPVFEARWLTGARQTKELVDLSTLGPQLNDKVAIFLTLKVSQAWMSSNAANGYQPFKDVIAKFTTQIAQSDIDSERRGKALLFEVVRDIDRHLDDAIPDALYGALKP